MFFGGMLMYLKTEDVISLLRKLIPFLEAGGMMLTLLISTGVVHETP